MSWPEPNYSKNQINRAGEVLRGIRTDKPSYSNALNILGNWRSAHGYPINTFQATLRSRLKEIDKKGFVAQRLKRTPAVIAKLQRIPDMRLARMQDIGGLRAVVTSVSKLKELTELYKNRRLDHNLKRTYDYLSNPKKSGYRSIHLVYEYNNRRKTEYNGLFIELQFRTKLQHSWATAVETMGTYLNQSLKSSEGESEWLDFFSAASAAFTFLEKTSIIPGYEDYTENDLFAHVIEEAERLKILDQLDGLRVATNHIYHDRNPGAYHLIKLDLTAKKLTIYTFSKRELDEANELYSALERQIASGENLQVVLVSAGPVRDLIKAYPNYYLDTKDFAKNLRKVENRLNELTLQNFDDVYQKQKI